MFPDIKDVTNYINGMQKSILDKLFFLDKIEEPYILLDFGCADGFILSNLSSISPQNTYFGYDKSKELLQKAIKKENITYSDNFYYLLNKMDSYQNTFKVLFLSSVIHEIYSYSSTEEIDIFWNQVFKSKFDYIIIRDMIPLQSINRPSYDSDVQKIYASLQQEKLATKLHHLNDFQSFWGNITDYKTLIHFLLKYRYLENWEREVRENYMPLCLESLYGLIPSTYTISYKEHYILPFLQNKIKEDFNILVKEPTHLKLILQPS